MASSNYDIPSVFANALETLLLFESKKLIQYEAKQANLDPQALFESVQPHLKYGIPSVFWDQFEPSLKGRVIQFIKTCAAVLAVDPAKLLKAVMPAKDMSRIYIQQSPYDTIDCACKAFTSLAGGEFAARCFLPTIPHTSYCSSHQYFRPTIQPRIDQGMPLLKEYERLKSAPDRPELWVDPETGAVFNANLQPAGFYNKDTGHLILMRQSK